MGIYTGAARPFFSTSFETTDEGEFVVVTFHAPGGTPPIVIGIPRAAWLASMNEAAEYWLVPDGIGGRPRLM